MGDVTFVATRRGGDAITFTILTDGTLKAETGKVSMANHGHAEALLRQIAVDLGGEVVVTKKAVHARHGHHHDEHEKE